MSGPNRKREVQVNFRVSPQELEMIEQKMAQLGTYNRLWQFALSAALSEIGKSVFSLAGGAGGERVALSG